MYVIYKPFTIITVINVIYHCYLKIVFSHFSFQFFCTTCSSVLTLQLRSYSVRELHKMQNENLQVCEHAEPSASDFQELHGVVLHTDIHRSKWNWDANKQLKHTIFYPAVQLEIQIRCWCSRIELHMSQTTPTVPNVPKISREGGCFLWSSNLKLVNTSYKRQVPAREGRALRVTTIQLGTASINSRKFSHAKCVARSEWFWVVCHY